MKHYVCYHSAGSFYFSADSKQLAIDHANHHCNVMGWDLKLVIRAGGSV